MTNDTDYTDELEIEDGDTLTIQAESDVSEALNGELEITARSDLGSETVCDKPGFEHETRADEVILKLANDDTVYLRIRQSSLFDERDDVIARIDWQPGKTIAKVTDIEVQG